MYNFDFRVSHDECLALNNVLANIAFAIFKVDEISTSKLISHPLPVVYKPFRNHPTSYTLKMEKGTFAETLASTQHLTGLSPSSKAELQPRKPMDKRILKTLSRDDNKTIILCVSQQSSNSVNFQF